MRVPFLYFVFGVFWVAAGDALLFLFVSNPEQLQAIGNAKGVIFVLLGTGLISVLLRWEEHNRRHAAEALRRSEQKFSNFFRCSPQPTIITTLDTGATIDLNDSMEQMLGYSREEIVGHNSWEFRIWTDSDQRNQWRDELRSKRSVREFEMSFRTKAGEERLAVISSDLLEVDDKTCILTTALDVTEQRAMAEALIESQARFERMVANIPGTVYQFVLRADGTTYFNFVSEGVREFTGIDRTQAQNDSHLLINLIHPNDRDGFKINMERSASTLEPWNWEGRYISANGEEKWVQGVSRPHRRPNGDTVWDGVLTDISERKQIEAQLAHTARHDALTGLANRAALMDYLKRVMALKQRHAECDFGLLFLDLDHFKNVNDSLGHVAGDQLLVDVAQRLQGALRPTDTLARLGGDEFAVLLESVQDLTEATHIAERLQVLLSQPFHIAGTELFVPASIGIVVSCGLADSGYASPEEVLRDADTAMYRAKSHGRARYAIFDIQMHTQILARLEIESALRRAVETAQNGNSEFRLYYQPIIELSTGYVAAFEALLRWEKPGLEILISPEEFIPVAEDTGLITSLGVWVLREACRQMNEWTQMLKANYGEAAPFFAVSVNLSSKQFAQLDVCEQVEAALQEFGLPPQHLKIEITESVLMENNASAAMTLSRLRANGIQLSMDDFGTGYSSLSYLHNFTMDTLKIDRSFVNNLGNNEGSREVVQSIISMASSLKMAVIAEGVETAEQFADLREMQCGFGQGYFFAPPLEAKAVPDFIAKRQGSTT